MIKLSISIILFLSVISCETVSKNNIPNSENNNQFNTINEKNVFYYIGNPYFVDGTKYTPKEDYSYEELGLASFYGKELHNVKTINNDFNKVTELLGRHKTLPLPSVVKVTNIENGLSVVVKIIDRYDDKNSIIQVSRKVAQLLRFYKSKIARVRIEILPDASKQWKGVSLSMSEPSFNETILSAPTDNVSISNLEDSDQNKIFLSDPETPIEIVLEPTQDTDLYIKIYGFKKYQDIEKILIDLNTSIKSTTEGYESEYNLILGPIKNKEANKLVSYFNSKGYKNTEIILK